MKYESTCCYICCSSDAQGRPSMFGQDELAIFEMPQMRDSTAARWCRDEQIAWQACMRCKAVDDELQRWLF